MFHKLLASLLVLHPSCLECVQVLLSREFNSPGKFLRGIVHHNQGEVALRQFDVAFVLCGHRRETFVETAVGLIVGIDAHSVGLYSAGVPVRFHEHCGSPGGGIVQMVEPAGRDERRNQNCCKAYISETVSHLLPPFPDEIIHTRDILALVGRNPMLLFVSQGYSMAFMSPNFVSLTLMYSRKLQ